MPTDSDITPEFKTLAILEQYKKAPDSRMTIPSQKAIKDAKDWVDSNEK